MTWPGFLVGLQGTEQDAVVVEPCAPDEGRLLAAARQRREALQAFGFQDLPEVLDLATARRSQGRWVPYCWSEQVARELGRGAPVAPHGKSWAAQLAATWRQEFGAELRRRGVGLAREAKVCATEAEVLNALQDLGESL